MSTALPVDEVARERWLTAVHEGGHAAATVVHGLPLYDALVVEKRHWGGLVSFSGEVRMSRRGGTYISDDQVDAYIVGALAGPAAEAKALHRLDGGSLGALRERMYRASRDGDMDRIRDVVHLSTLTLRQAKAAGEALVDAHWSSIESVARGLAERGRLSERQIRGLVR